MTMVDPSHHGKSRGLLAREAHPTASQQLICTSLNAVHAHFSQKRSYVVGDPDGHSRGIEV
jgi:hypothetical protein